MLGGGKCEYYNKVQTNLVLGDGAVGVADELLVGREVVADRRLVKRRVGVVNHVLEVRVHEADT